MCQYFYELVELELCYPVSVIQAGLLLIIQMRVLEGAGKPWELRNDP
jgi:hypothetical protein